MRRAQTENRRAPWRRRLVLAVWMLSALVICARAVQIQVVQGAAWQAIAADQHTTDVEVSAPRGAILDRDGAQLAVSRETFRVSVAPREVEDRAAVSALLEETLDVSPQRARQATAEGRVWNVLPGAFGPHVRDLLSGVRGVYLERDLQRHYPHGDLARAVLGVVIDEAGQGGVEQAFDGQLRGRSGREVVARDNFGQPIPGETFAVAAPLEGAQVVLTLDLDLQEIARQALQEAIDSTHARGGDVLISDPKTGEVLALVSVRDGKPAGLGAVNTPYEPGSTLKPFTVAALLETGLGSLSDLVDGENGSWTVEGRTLRDVHAEGVMTIADALRLSSNVGIAKAAQALAPGQHYEILRDLGFGVPTGIRIPGEAAGTLRRPDRWSRQSSVSLAIGYEISVTPLQMAMAYGALANGGLLMEPQLVKEIRAPDGRVLEKVEPRVVRRVVGARVARDVSRVLVDVVEDGTGTAARLSSFTVAGKSGTSRAYAPEGGYINGSYHSSFVGFFPAEDPQLVVFVKLEDPRGAYYGGAVAAPVTRATMEAALAARTTALDRGQLLRAARTEPSVPARTAVQFASRSIDPSPPPAALFSEDAGIEVVEAGEEILAEDGTPPGLGLALPDMAGLPARTAIRRLHGLGLRVRVEGVGEIVGTVPEAGTRVLPGDTVSLSMEGRRDE